MMNVYIMLSDHKNQLTIDGSLDLLGRFISTVHGGESVKLDLKHNKSNAETEPRELAPAGAPT